MDFEGPIGFIKFDHNTGQKEVLRLDRRYATGEAILVPHYDKLDKGGNEDDGYLMGYVYDAETHTSDLWIHDATKLSAGPIAKIKLPVRVPVGFHGTWLPDSALQSL